MNPQSRAWPTRTMLALLIVMIGLGGAGCKKFRANLKLKKFDKISRDAEKYNPHTHVPSEAEQAVARADDARQQIAGQNYESALPAAIEAVQRMKEVLLKAREMEAQAQWDNAQLERAVADNNNAQIEDAELWSKILESYKAAQEDWTNQKWDNVIKESRTVIDYVQQILQRLKTQSEAEIKTAKSGREAMLQEGAEEHAPTFVEEVDRLIAKAEEEYDPENRKYRVAIQRAKEAQTKATEGITETQKQISLLMIGEIERLLVIAQNLDAAVWAKATMEVVQDKYEALNDTHFETEDYVLAQSHAIRLKPLVEQMIYETRRKRAEAALADFEGELAKLLSEKAKDYLEEQVVEVENQRDTAKTLLDLKTEDGFSEVEKVCTKGQTMIASVRASFDNYTQREIREARSAYTIASDVFERMKNVFLIKPAEFIKKIDIEFENNKEALRQTLSSTLIDVDANLTQAEGLRASEQKYHDAIQLARTEKARANSVLADTYNVVAHNAINEVADQLSRWERDGGKEWAAETIKECRAALEKAIELRDLEKYQLAIAASAEARWKLDFVIQTIEQKAVRELEAAKQSIQHARDQQALNYQREDLMRAEQLYRTAQEELRREHLKQTILGAIEAQTIATRAAATASQMWTTDQLALAAAEVGKTEQSGAAAFAETLLDQAQDLLASARQFDDEHKLPSARLAAAQAIEHARRARYAKIDRADETISIVRRYGGWKYDKQNLSNAIIMNRQARQLMENAGYDQANLLATDAQLLAARVLNHSKIKAFDEQLQETKATLKDVLGSGAKFYQMGTIRRMLDEIDEVEHTFNVSNFDEISVRTNRIHKTLNSLLTDTPGAVEKTIANQRSKIALIEEDDRAVFLRNDLAQAKSYLNIASVEFKKEKFSRSYANLKRANQIIQRLDNRLGEDVYLADVRRILAEYARANEAFAQVLQLDPQSMLAFTRGPDGGSQFVAIAGGLTPLQYRTQIDSLYAQAIQLKPPAGIEILHRELLFIMKNSQQAAVNFEKLLILDHFDGRTVEEIILRAYDLTSKARKKQQELSKRLLHEGTVTHQI
ncbi:hypothetical protein ACFL34_02440 [Candidatus Sumerlaeota bacterium]